MCGEYAVPETSHSSVSLSAAQSGRINQSKIFAAPPVAQFSVGVNIHTQQRDVSHDASSTAISNIAVITLIQCP
jgi:hypothetical protein